MVLELELGQRNGPSTYLHSTFYIQIRRVVTRRIFVLYYIMDEELPVYTARDRALRLASLGKGVQMKLAIRNR